MHVALAELAGANWPGGHALQPELDLKVPGGQRPGKAQMLSFSFALSPRCRTRLAVQCTGCFGVHVVADEAASV